VLPGDRYAEADVVGGIFAGRSPYETGWFRPLREPRRLAGVDLPEGETDTTPADETAVADALGRVFAVRPVEAQAAAPGADHERLRPVAAPVAWVLMGLVLAEAFLANRMRR